MISAKIQDFHEKNKYILFFNNKRIHQFSDITSPYCRTRLDDAGEDSGEIGSRRETDMISYFFQCGTGMSQHIGLCLLDAQGGNPGTEIDGMFPIDITGKINLIGAHFGSQTVDGQLG